VEGGHQLLPHSSSARLRTDQHFVDLGAVACGWPIRQVQLAGADKLLLRVSGEQKADT
jgi:hypothetical protein